MENNITQSTKKWLFGLFIGEILVIVSLICVAIANNVAAAKGLGFLSIAAVIGLIVILISSIILRKTNSHFYRAFIFSIADLIFTILTVTFTMLLSYNEGNLAYSYLLIAFGLCEKILSIVVLFCVLMGCKEIAEVKDSENVAYFCRNTMIISVSSIAINILLSCIIDFKAVSIEHPVYPFIFWLAIALEVAGYVMYLIALIRTEKLIK